MKKNILIVTSEFPPQPGGIGNHAYNLALHLSQQNFEVEVIADQRSKNGEAEFDFDNNLPFKVTRIERRDLRLRMYIQRFLATRKRINKAAHIIATGKFSLWNVALCNLLIKRSILAVVHGSEVNFKSYPLRKSIDIALKQYQHVIAVSTFTKSLISYLNLPVTVIPNGINLESWQKVERAKLSIKGAPVITTVGRVSSRKGQLNVIKLLPTLIRDFPDVHYHCIGIPTEAAQFIKVAEALNVASNVSFHGELEENKLKQMLEITDIFVMLSSESISGDVEGFGIAILEANALSVPAIGAIGCGIEDAINSGESGLLIDPNDADAFKESITSILNAKTEYKESTKRWAEIHDWSKIIKRYIALLE